MKPKIKKIVAREGLVIIGILIVSVIIYFLLPCEKNEVLLLIIALAIYFLRPIYVPLIIWAVKTLFPRLFMPHQKVAQLIKEQKFIEALDMMEKMEATPNANLQGEKGWEDLKKACGEGMIVFQVYSRAMELMKAKKYDEAKNLASEGVKTILKHKEYFGITEDEIKNFLAEMRAAINDPTATTLGAIYKFRDDYVKRYKERAGATKTVVNMELLLDMTLVPIMADAMRDKDAKQP